MQNNSDTMSIAVAAENSSTDVTTVSVVAVESSSTSVTTGTCLDIFSDIDAFFSPTTSDDIFYSHLFSQPSNVTSETSSANSCDTFGGDFQPHQSSYVQLYNSYTLSLSHLQDSLKKVDSLCRENEALRLANAELTHRLSVLSHQATIQNCLLSEPSNLATELETHNQFGGKNVGLESFSLPKSISVRSRLQMKPNVNENNTRPNLSRYGRAMVRSPKPQEILNLAPGKIEDEALEFKVYNQGMSKTELCNKWQETGACPYGDNCRFAHGIHELRPVIRHPRYKTAVCRMVLAGENCPYGHRCHFRHNLTDEERLIAARSFHASH